ncbi:ABC transporter transmembrane domain-containing protein [Streptomyces sp. FR-108]|uniref:ABC transporter transmembrane domain-containing protein n=1 Tax=Streptomyces sp. FR-108 TaxID=3416665 RepID=UPI003CF4C795
MALTPYLLARAIDDGLERGDLAALACWCAALLGLGVFNAVVGVLRHRTMTKVRMDANFRSVKLVVGQATRLGAGLSRQTGTGEVVTIGVGDVLTISGALTVVGPGVGSVAAYVVVAGLLLSVSPPLAAVVLIGIPVIVVLIGPLMGRLRGAETEYRELQGTLTARIGDLAGGLRVLNGLGGKGLFADAFRRDSRLLRDQGYRVGAVTSWLQALGVGLPTVFLAVVTWLAARLAAQGSLTVGELVSVYGYAAVLVGPVAFFVECGHQISRGVVAARRVVRFLALEPLIADGSPAAPAKNSPAGPAKNSSADPGARPPLDAPAEPSVLHDPRSGVRVVPGALTALAGARPAESAAVVDRLGRYVESAATWGGVRLDAIALPRIRERVLVADHEADLFAGTLRELLAGRLDPHGPGGADEAAVGRAVRAAVADDIVLGLPDGLDSAVDAQGRNLSGGQRQRVRLARALLADPEVLLAIEPTSALDAHTEAAVAARLRAARAGRTTLVTSTSPLVLDQADTVYYLVDGEVAAVGGHRELLAGEPGYRALVARDADPDGREAGNTAGREAQETREARDTREAPEAPEADVTGRAAAAEEAVR